ncbi:hypothetical protein F4859DRAFT_253197 [Xylaria cf. heliscus]|nr:hypothetical protein F4859DRAFT_253197 [Xylaria cf. heliscus]
MLAMTRLPSDSFLPSGGLDSFDHSHLHRRPDSMISPLSLPNSLQYPSLDASNSIKQSPSSRAPSSSLAVPSNPQQSLTSDRHSLATPTKGMPSSSVTSPSMAPTHPGAMSPFEHLSPQTTATLLQRREEYSRRLHENWQAERAHMEASRARAEEMFREERDMMDEERLLWLEQKTKLEKEIMDWKQRTATAETEVAKLTKLLGNRHNGAGKPGAFVDGTIEKVLGNPRLGSSDSPATIGLSTGTIRTPSDSVSPSSLPPGRGITIAESNPFVPLDPRMQSSSPNNISTRQEQDRVPSIDINEVIPGLEGIRLRAPAVQKPTFNDEKPSSPTSAPTKGSPLNPGKGPAEPQSKASHSVRVQAALLAPEHRRLTMHAGHTPNHSMSFSKNPTLESTTTNTAGSTGTSTPTSPSDLKVGQLDKAQDQIKPAVLPDANQESHEALGLNYDGDMPGEAVLEPSDDDPALKGPLCLKNRPAADEAFLRRLSDKLEEVKATDATPSVLNGPEISENAGKDLTNLAAILSTVPTKDSHTDDEPEDVEEEIPLKLKKSSNFGQPLGHVRRTVGF